MYNTLAAGMNPQIDRIGYENMPDNVRYACRKLEVIARRNGIIISDNQPSVRTLYDTINITSALTQGTALEFFTNLSSKSYPYTNLNNNQLSAGESMVVADIAFSIFTAANDGAVSIYPKDTACTQDFTFEEFSQIASAVQYGSLNQLEWNLLINQSQVIKQVQFGTRMGKFNNLSGLAFDSNGGNLLSSSVNAVESMPVILPNITFSVTSKMPKLSAASTQGSYFTGKQVFVKCTLKGFATVAASNTPL